MIMEQFNEMALRRHDSGHDDHDQDQDEEEERMKIKNGAHGHVDHCFRYLRQSILCCGDTALEGQDPDNHVLPATDGTGAVHVCKDYDAIRSWADEHRFMDSRNL